MTALWQRYFLKEILKIFLLFIGCFYFLYVLIDFSAHTKTFQNENLHLREIIVYYLFQFTKRADILVPIALLIATIKVLTTLNLKNEVVALVSSGIPLRSLLKPFFFVAGLCALFLYVNFQWIQPQAMARVDAFEESYFHHNAKDTGMVPVNSLYLKDRSLLIYQSFDPIRKQFFDVYWIRDFNEIYHMKRLQPFNKIPTGNFVDRLVRTQAGEIVRIYSQQEVTFPHMEFDEKVLYAAAHPPFSQTLSELFHHFPWKEWNSSKMSDRDAQVATYFYYKLLLPTLCFLVVLAPAPFCLRFSRRQRIFLIYALSLFGMIGFFTLVNSSVILGESQVIPPLWALCTPFLALYLMCGWRYAKL